MYTSKFFLVLINGFLQIKENTRKTHKKRTAVAYTLYGDNLETMK